MSSLVVMSKCYSIKLFKLRRTWDVTSKIKHVIIFSSTSNIYRYLVNRLKRKVFNQFMLIYSFLSIGTVFVVTIHLVSWVCRKYCLYGFPGVMTLQSDQLIYIDQAEYTKIFLFCIRRIHSIYCPEVRGEIIVNISCTWNY